MRTPALAALGALLTLAACSSDDAPADGADTPEVTVTARRDIRALAPSEITIGAAGASGTAGSGAASTAATSTVRSSNAAVQRVFSQFNARQTAGGIVLTLPENVLFDFDQSALRSDAEGALAQVQTVLAEYADAPVEVVGHTDAKGEDAYNQMLSERRAQAVQTWLAGHGVAASRLTATGRGETQPAVPNETPQGQDDPAGRQQNRRVEIVLKGVTGGATGAAGGTPTSTIRTTPADSSR